MNDKISGINVTCDQPRLKVYDVRFEFGSLHKFLTAGYLALGAGILAGSIMSGHFGTLPVIMMIICGFGAANSGLQVFRKHFRNK